MSLTTQGPVVEFHYDISCPFAYIASTKIEALVSRTGAHLIWRPVLLGAIYRATAAPQGAAGSASDVFNSTKKAVTTRATQRTIHRHGIPYNEPPNHPMKTTAALRLLYFVPESARAALSHSLFRAYWVDRKSISAKSTLIAAVRQARIPESELVIQAIESGAFETPHERKLLEQATNDAVARGAPGVPGFYLPTAGRLYWGQDRVHFLEASLRALSAGHAADAWQTDAAPLRALVPHCTRAAIRADEDVKLEFWFDFSSPWAYLGWTQLASLQARFGPRLQVELKPFLLGILFRQIGAPDTPMSAVSIAKREYMLLDHADWVRWWNAVARQEGSEGVGFYWADRFPIRTPTALRVSLVEPGLTGVLFRACWERNLDMSDDEVVVKVVTEAGYDGRALLARSNEANFKADLRVRTKEAKDVGICGVPTYRVFRKEAGQSDDAWKQSGDLVWGQDEIAVVEDLIVGWDGTGIASTDDSVAKQGHSKL